MTANREDIDFNLMLADMELDLLDWTPAQPAMQHMVVNGSFEAIASKQAMMQSDQGPFNNRKGN